jgi:hypothetical protein
MRFPKICFAVAGWWGVLSLTPLFFFYKGIGKLSPPPLNHPEYYFGFVTVALAWQVGFLIISRDPSRYRAMMLPAMIEKFGYAACCFVLFANHQATSSTATFGGVDLLLGLSFLLAYLRVGSHQAQISS